MQIQQTRANGLARIELNGRFDFSSHRLFRSACDAAFADAEVKGVEIDFAGVDYLDSSALGMLLLARERAASSGRQVELVNCRGTVGEVLYIANFSKLFTIS
ncbi:MAG: STAS domain-containing protein [Proteobacteria bacterium]|nr:STAS domain-containing protein [Pseudomonadota bacterium]